MASKQQNGYTETVQVCVIESVLCSVIEIYLFIYAFLSSNLYTFVYLMFFQRNTLIILVDFLSIFLLGDEDKCQNHPLVDVL